MLSSQRLYGTRVVPFNRSFVDWDLLILLIALAPWLWLFVPSVEIRILGVLYCTSAVVAPVVLRTHFSHEFANSVHLSSIKQFGMPLVESIACTPLSRCALSIARSINRILHG